MNFRCQCTQQKLQSICAVLTFDPQLKKSLAFSVKDRYQLNYFICIKDFNAETITSLKLNLFSFFICSCEHHERKTICLYVYISDISYSLTCGVCGQYFNRLDILARHRAQHERPEAKQRPPMKRPAAPESGPSPKQRRTVSPPTNIHQENIRVAADSEVLPDDPKTRALHRQHWQSIRTEEATGNVYKTTTTLHFMR